MSDPTKSRGRPPELPWEVWTDGTERRLYKGTEAEVLAGDKDFKAELTSLRAMVHRKAREMGPHIGARCTNLNKADESIKVQFYVRQDGA